MTPVFGTPVPRAIIRYTGVQLLTDADCNCSVQVNKPYRSVSVILRGAWL